MCVHVFGVLMCVRVFGVLVCVCEMQVVQVCLCVCMHVCV